MRVGAQSEVGNVETVFTTGSTCEVTALYIKTDPSACYISISRAVSPSWWLYAFGSIEYQELLWGLLVCVSVGT